MSDNYELALYKLIMNPEEDDEDVSYVNEFGWISDTEFCVWISLLWFQEFVYSLKQIFGYGLFDDGGIEARIGSDYVVIDLAAYVEGYGVEIENIFPKEKYRH